MDVNEAWDVLENLGVSEQTLQVATGLNGYSLETMTDVLYVLFGYRSFEQIS